MVSVSAKPREADRVVYLNPDSIADPTNNSRTEDEPGSEAEAPTDEPGFGQLVRTVKRRGLLQPIGVRPTGANKYELVFGSRRLAAWKIARPGEKIPCLLKDDRGDFEALVDNLNENYHRRKLSPWMLAETFCKMRDLAPEMTVAAIALEAGVTEFYCASLIRIRRKLRPDLWELYKRWGDSMRVSYNEVVEVARLPHDEQLIRWNELVDAKGKVGGGKVRGKQRRPGERRLRRYLEVVEAGVEGKSREWHRVAAHVLRVALGEKRWGFGEGRSRRQKKSA